MTATVGAGARGKGAAGEREVKIILRSILQQVYLYHTVPLPEFERNLEQSRGGGYDLKGLEWLAIEVKRQERSNLTAWWEQTLRQCGEHQIPFLIHRANHQPWRVRTILSVAIAFSTKQLPLTVDMERDQWEQWLQWQCFKRLQRDAEKEVDDTGDYVERLKVL